MRKMPYLPLKQRLKIALGGFVSLVGFMILLFALLTTTGNVNLGTLQNWLIFTAAAIVGILDLICGFLLVRKK